MAVSDTAAETAALGPPPATTGFVGWLRRNLFSNVWNTVLTLVAGYLLYVIIPPAVSWLFADAVWSEAPPETCKAAHGACWAFIREKHRVIFFGRYPFFEHWRPLLGVALLVTMVLVSCFRRFWRPWIVVVWAGGLGAFFLVMAGGDIALNLRTSAAAIGLVLLAPLASGPISGRARRVLLWIGGLALLFAIAGRHVLRVFDWLFDLAGIGRVFGEPGSFGFVLVAAIGVILLVMPLGGGVSRAARNALFWIAGLLLFLALAANSIIRVLDAVLKELFGIEPLLTAAAATWVEIPTGMSLVPTALWGGLPLTLLLSIVGIVVAFPLAILLALGRRSKLPLIKMFCIGYIEIIRGVPLISLLFVGSFLLPLFLPRGVEISDLVRAQVAIIGFSAAYLAEVIRGGLQAIPRGQYEAADALGLGYWQKTAKIILPQAIVIVIPPIVNTFIGLFKDTSLVSIVSLTDLLLATKDMAIGDVNWRVFYAEGYTFIALIYFVFCFFMSQYSQYLERQFETGRRKRR